MCVCLYYSMCDMDVCHVTILDLFLSFVSDFIYTHSLYLRQCVCTSLHRYESAVRAGLCICVCVMHNGTVCGACTVQTLLTLEVHNWPNLLNKKENPKKLALFHSHSHSLRLHLTAPHQYNCCKSTSLSLAATAAAAAAALSMYVHRE